MIDIDVLVTRYGATITLGPDTWVLPEDAMVKLTGPLADEWFRLLASMDSTAYDSTHVTAIFTHWFALQGVSAMCLQGVSA